MVVVLAVQPALFVEPHWLGIQYRAGAIYSQNSSSAVPMAKVITLLNRGHHSDECAQKVCSKPKFVNSSQEKVMNFCL